MQNNEELLKQYEILGEFFCKKGLGTILLFILEAHKPLVNIANQAIHCFLPLVKIFMKKEFVPIFLSLFESKDNYEKFIKILDEKLNKK